MKIVPIKLENEGHWARYFYRPATLVTKDSPSRVRWMAGLRFYLPKRHTHLEGLRYIVIGEAYPALTQVLQVTIDHG